MNDRKVSAADAMGILRETLADVIGVTPFMVKEETAIDSLGLDTLDLTEWCMAVEDKLGIIISEDDLFEAKTVGDLARAVGETVERSLPRRDARARGASVG